ncbi:MAG: ComF family protein [Methylophilaceae bacterium]
MLNFSRVAQVLFQQNCLLCAAAETDHTGLCAPCLSELPYAPTTSCPQCGLNANGLVCGSCINAAPDFDATHAVFTYVFPIDAMIQRYKYGHLLPLGQLFSQHLAQKVSASSVDLIIPMPMHPTRLKQRGFNQALEIAKSLTKHQAEKIDYKSVIRSKLTPPQASLPLKQRVKNIKGAFKVNTDLTGKRIAIVDDVMTSGASLNELAKTLKKAGAARVECWVVARTLPHT